MSEQPASPTANRAVTPGAPSTTATVPVVAGPPSSVVGSLIDEAKPIGAGAPSIAPSVIPSAPTVVGAAAREVVSLVDEAKAIAAGVTSIATHFPPKRMSGWWPRVRRAKPFLLALPVLIGALFTLEQFLESQEEAESSRAEARFSATTQQLASSQLAIQAAAVHSLPQIATFRDVPRPQPGDYFLGAHMINRFVRSRREYPFMQRSWALFREFAAQPRISISVEPLGDNVVSSAILKEGAAWELRRRMETGPTDEATGALLFKANLPNAHGIRQDFRRINFGAVDLTNAVLDGSNFDDCGLSGARLDGAILRSTSLKSAYLADARMANADLSFAHLDEADFKRALLRGAKFTQTILVRADFTDGTLDKATFSQATASHAIFRNASLKRVVFEQTDVSSALFDGADVDGADFTTSVGFTNATLRGAKNVKKARLPAGYAPQRRRRVP